MLEKLQKSLIHHLLTLCLDFKVKMSEQQQSTLYFQLINRTLGTQIGILNKTDTNAFSESTHRPDCRHYVAK